MEHALINEFIKLLCKSGGETFVGNFQKDIQQDGQAEKWTPEEITEALKYMRYINEFFGRDEAAAVIIALAAKYNIDLSELSARNASMYNVASGK